MNIYTSLYIYLFEARNIESSLVYLLELNHLEHLDVSINNFSYSKIPKFMGSMKQLRYLNLSYMMPSLCGKVPDELGNLTNLQVLDLSIVITDYEHHLFTHSLKWVSNLRQLRHLGLGGMNLSQVNNLIDSLIEPLPFVRVLDLSLCSLLTTQLNLKNLSIASHPISIRKLVLNSNNLEGKIPSFIQNLTSLEYLDLSLNNFGTQIPLWLGEHKSLVHLDLGDAGFTSVEGGDIWSVVSNLHNLTYLDISRTFLTLNFSSDWVPPFQLQTFSARTCRINGPFPQWLKTQKSLSYLALSNAGIHGPLPKWFHEMQSLTDVYLGNNQITGCLIFPINFVSFYLFNNSLSCQYMMNTSRRTKINYHAGTFVKLSDNFISGQFLEHLYHEMPNVALLDLSNNQINGSIPKSMCQFTLLSYLMLRKNRLSGTIPRCLGESSDLQFVDLAFNNLSGDIPCFRVAHVGWSFSSLDFVSLSDNMLSGRIPSCLANLSNLEVLDVGENNLSGEIPTFITRVNVPGLQILRLRNNKLEGSIPEQLCSLSKLQILDLGHNYLTGIIPSCLSNLTEMNLRHPSVFGFNRMADVNEIIKGTDREYTKTIGFMVNIDLSCNKLIGSIPEKITNLPSLVGLNLSYNQLSGHIPGSIGGLKSLESLDLSRNKLHGTIPTSLGAISPLEFLDLSYNNLSGQIPTGNQLQTLNDPLSYAGNPYLCGDPLSKKCKSNHDSTNGSSGAQNNEDEESEDKHETMWFYLVVMSGFATGFWCVVGTLFLNKSWRHAFFRRVEFVQDWLYVAVVVRVPKLMRRFI
ncbi:receptor-like protein EIX2 isoform X1 [Spinacia oleracea]|uniref:Receptor-like protein EIX2 isoform X1 n=1 Tax=Spinacia oleracea TaxID=3562 RepID=A0A9R0IA13_SPIOL|nr:receptor-like protein EIX2 isoform X1 [Spinacia oleracea]XP_021844279.2 receptor-like protein EIX2 isoform X1 [Spinacia oleracea]